MEEVLLQVLPIVLQTVLLLIGKVYKIGICQQLEHEALDQATQGFEDACEEKFGKDNVTFDLQNGQGEQANCATITNSFVADNVDLILANATTALQCAAAATDSIRF